MGLKRNHCEVTAAGGRTVSYTEAGEGVPLVFLHGIGSGARSWSSQIDGLSDRYRVIAWDAPGYGSSSPVLSSEPDAGHYVDVLAQFVSSLRLDRFHLVGHSLGALIAARYALEHRPKLRSLTLASIASGHAMHSMEERARLRAGRLEILAKLGPRRMAEERGRLLLSGAATDAMRQAVIETMAAIRPEGYRQAVFLLSGGDTRADVLRLADDLPVQVIFGSADTVTTPEQNRRVASACARAPISIIDGAGHAVYIEKAEQFNQTLRDFLEHVDDHRMVRSA